MDENFNKALRALDKLLIDVQEHKRGQREFWKHVTIILVTVISFSSALFSVTDTSPNFFILSSLGLMLLGVLIGLLLIREDVDFEQHNNFIQAMFKYNDGILRSKIENGEIVVGSEKHKGLILAHIIETFKDNPYYTKRDLGLNSYAYKLAEKHVDQLPSREFLVNKGKSRYADPVQKLFLKRFNWIVNLFYLIIFSSLALLFTGFVVGYFFSTSLMN